jgi:uncharacterized UPF0160 family protein
MFQFKDLEEILEDKNKMIKELSIRNENLDRETKKFLEDLKVTSEQLTAFIEKKDNFTEKNWEVLQKEKNKLDQKLQTDIKSVRNPLDVKKTYAERKIDQHWLFVR